jgi:hypothetical protein
MGQHIGPVRRIRRGMVHDRERGRRRFGCRRIGLRGGRGLFQSGADRGPHQVVALVLQLALENQARGACGSTLLAQPQAELGDRAEAPQPIVGSQRCQSLRVNLRSADQRVAADHQIADAALDKPLRGRGRSLGARPAEQIAIERVHRDLLVLRGGLALFETVDQP